MKLPIVVTDKHGKQHQLWKLKYATDDKPLIKTLIANLSNPVKAAEAIEALIFLDGLYSFEREGKISKLASLTFISKHTAREIKDARNIRLKEKAQLWDHVRVGDYLLRYKVDSDDSSSLKVIGKNRKVLFTKEFCESTELQCEISILTERIKSGEALPSDKRGRK
jgi:hypothetical protein